MMVISMTDNDNDDDDDKLYKPKQPSVTNKIARIGRNTGVANLNYLRIIILMIDRDYDIFILMIVIMTFENLKNMRIRIQNIFGYYAKLEV